MDNSFIAISGYCNYTSGNQDSQGNLRGQWRRGKNTDPSASKWDLLSDRVFNVNNFRLSSVRVHVYGYRPFLGKGVQIIISNFCYYDTASGK
jgi:hypothetical protein